jgi:hypothetical protein
LSDFTVAGRKFSRENLEIDTEARGGDIPERTAAALLLRIENSYTKIAHEKHK